MMALNKKDLAGINQEIGCDSKFHNEDSIDFALSITKQKKSWLYELSYIVRSLLVDHCFVDGNKRTAIIVIITYFENNNLDYDKDKLIKIVWNISKKNISDINKLMRVIKNAIIPEMSANRKAISEHAQKSSIFDKAKQVIARNQDVITVFEELDRTGKFRKRTYKIRASFTLDEELFNKFRNYCKEKGINMSGKIENYLRNELKNIH